MRDLPIGPKVDKIMFGDYHIVEREVRKSLKSDIKVYRK